MLVVYTRSHVHPHTRDAENCLQRGCTALGGTSKSCLRTSQVLLENHGPRARQTRGAESPVSQNPWKHPSSAFWETQSLSWLFCIVDPSIGGRCRPQRGGCVELRWGKHRSPGSGLTGWNPPLYLSEHPHRLPLPSFLDRRVALRHILLSFQYWICP